MNAPSATLRLLAWLSPVFPVGGFSYSHGLERAVHDGLVGSRDDLSGWISTLIEVGSGWNDAVLFAEAHRRAAAMSDTPTPPHKGEGGRNVSASLPLVGRGRGGGDGQTGIFVDEKATSPERADLTDLTELAQLAEALAGSEERHRETMLQGSAFLSAAKGWPHPILELLPPDCPYCVAVGAVAGAHGLPLETALVAYLQAFASNLIQAGIRLGVTGQTGAVETLAGLEAVLVATATRAANSSLDDLGSATLLSDIAAMRHETQATRLFRS